MKQLRWPSSPPQPNLTGNEPPPVCHPTARHLAAGPVQDVFRQWRDGIQFPDIPVAPLSKVIAHCRRFGTKGRQALKGAVSRPSAPGAFARPLSDPQIRAAARLHPLAIRSRSVTAFGVRTGGFDCLPDPLRVVMDTILRFHALVRGTAIGSTVQNALPFATEKRGLTARGLPNTPHWACIQGMVNAGRRHGKR